MQLHDSDSPYLYEPVLLPVGTKKKDRRRLRPFLGLFVFCLFLFLFMQLGTPLYLYFGMYGNAFAEILVFGVGSVMAALALGMDLKNVFPLEKPEGLKVFGVVLLWFGGYRLMNAVFALTAVLFPYQLYEVAQDMSSSVQSVSLLSQFLVTALVPAITEEMFHRGFLQASLEPLKNRWVICLFMGVYFGLFHMSGVRFLPMCMLGVILAYIRHETGNILYAFLFHFLNNGYAVLEEFVASYLYYNPGASLSYQPDVAMDLIAFGQSLFGAAIVPVCLWCGAYLFHYNEKSKEGQLFAFTKHPTALKVSLLICTVLILLLAGLISVIGSLML